MKREELTPIELECNMGPDVNGVVQREPWKAYDIDEVNLLLDEKDAEIAALKEKLEDVQATAYADSVDAGMRERRLKRALYKACANWAHFAVAFFSSYAIKERWYKMERKCLAMAEKFK